MMNVPFPDDVNLFDVTENLSTNGRILLWREVNHFIQSLDQQQQDFTPRRDASASFDTRNNFKSPYAGHFNAAGYHPT